MLTRRQTQAANHTFPLLALLALTLALLLPLVQARFLISELSVDGTTLSETDRLKYVRDMGDRDVGATRGNNILACNAGGAPAVSLRLPVFAEAGKRGCVSSKWMRDDDDLWIHVPR